MAVPKKKVSKSRRNSRRTTWKKKVLKKMKVAFTIGNSLSSSNLIID